MKEWNQSMLCDFYELTMSNGYLKNGFYKKITYFDVFYRTVPDGGGFAIAAGWNRLSSILNNCIFQRKTSPISVPKICLMKNF